MCSLVEDKPGDPDEPPSQSGGSQMKRRMFGFALVIALALGASARSEAKNCSPLAGSYGYALSGLFFGPFGFVDVGAITLNCDGTLGGFEMNTHTLPPYPTATVQGTSNPITGTWSLDDDAINGTITSDSIVSPGGLYHFVVDDGGTVLRLSEVGGVYEVGRAVRQDPKYIASVIAGKVRGGNTTVQCTGYLPNFPFPDFANGAPVSIIGTEVTDKNGYLFKGIESRNFFSNNLTSTTPPTSTVNADGTGSGTDTFGTPVILVVTAPGEDFFTVPLNPDFLGYCVVHPR